MRPLSGQFRLRGLLVLVGLLAVALAVLRHALRHWGPGEVTTIALTLLVATNVLAWFQGPRWQTFWVGFGLVGVAYLLIALSSSTGEYLPTTWLLDDLHDRLFPAPALSTFADDFDEDVAGPVHGTRFRAAGQSVISLVFGLLGGLGARLLFPPRRDDPEEPRPPDGSLLKPGWREERDNAR
jgi:hypothetical protein